VNITVSREIINRLYTEDLFEQIKEYLNGVIDAELEKENCDTDLIDDCISALDAVQSHDTYPALKVMLRDKDIIRYCKRKTDLSGHKGAKAVAACLVVAVCASAALLNTDTAFARQIKDVFGNIIEALNRTADSSENSDDNDISSVYATFPPDHSFTAKNKNDIDLNGITVYAVYKDGSERVVPLSECTVSITDNKDAGQNSAVVVIAYKGCAVSVIYTIEEG